MNLEKYVAGKATGDSGVMLHGATTLLVKSPAGFDPTTGAKLPPVEQGFQLADIQAMRVACAKDVATAQAQLDKANTLAAAADTLLADALAVLPKG